MGETDVKAISRRRGVTSEFNTFTTGLEGEITVNTTNNSVVVSDGNGNNFEAARADLNNVDQFDVLKKGIADNDLSNTVVNYTVDVSGLLYKTKKTADQIVAQLTNAGIADKNLYNVPLNIILEKGIAKQGLENVSYSALSWDSTDTERLGYLVGDDITGGGFIFRNLDNVKVERFNNFKETDNASLTGSGLAYKTLKNVSKLDPSVMVTMGVANIDLTNVSDNSFYGKDTIVSEETDKGKYALKRDLSNIHGDHVSINSLTYAGIASKDLTNITISTSERPTLQDKFGVPDYNLRNVNASVLTDTSSSGRFKLMSYDASNAEKEIVFKGQKNLLLNGDFSIKNDFFADKGNINSNAVANVGDSFYANWVAYTNGSYISVSSGLVSMSGKWGQTIAWNDEFLTTGKLYCSVDTDGLVASFNVSLCQPKNGSFVEIVKQTSYYNDANYNRVCFDLNFSTANLTKGVPLVLMLESKSSGSVFKFKRMQLERNNVSNFEHHSQNIAEALSGIRSKKVVMLTILDDISSALETFVTLTPNFSSDPSGDYYARLSDVSGTTDTYLPYSIPVYCYVGDKLTFYTNAANHEFTMKKSGDNYVTIQGSVYAIGDLVYSKANKKIYTFAKDNFYLLYDPEPYSGPLYLDLYPGREAVYVWNSTQKEFKPVSGSSSLLGSSLPLFMHVLSDRKLESACWSESDSFSKKYASLYNSAYQYLIDQVHPTGKIIAGGSYQFTGDESYVEQIGREATWLIQWSDNKIEDTQVLLKESTSTAWPAIKTFLQSKGYTFTNPSTDPIHNTVITRVIPAETENGITFYKTFDGLKIVYETSASIEAVRQSFENTGYGWYYLLFEGSTPDLSYFRLPRIKGYGIDTNSLEEEIGDSYASNVVIPTTNKSSLSVINKKLYFYMGFSKFSDEEISVNKVFGALSQIDRKLDCTINDSAEIPQTYDSAEQEYCFNLAITNRAHTYIIRPTVGDVTVRLSLDNLLGGSDPRKENERWIYPLGSYDEHTVIEFDLLVDRNNAPNNKVHFDFKYDSGDGSSTAYPVPVVSYDSTNYTLYHVKSFVKAGYSASTTISRKMFGFIIGSPAVNDSVKVLDLQTGNIDPNGENKNVSQDLLVSKTVNDRTLSRIDFVHTKTLNSMEFYVHGTSTFTDPTLGISAIRSDTAEVPIAYVVTPDEGILNSYPMFYSMQITNVGYVQSYVTSYVTTSLTNKIDNKITTVSQNSKTLIKSYDSKEFLASHILAGLDPNFTNTKNMRVCIVSTMPASPDANTLYLVSE